MHLSRELFRKAAMAIGVGAFALVRLPEEASAAVITYDFAGSVVQITAPLTSTFTIGQVMTGSVSFETTTPPDPSGTSASAFFPGAVTALQFKVGSYIGSSTGGTISINNAAIDQFNVVSFVGGGLVGPPASGLALQSFQLRLNDHSGTVFDTALTIPLLLNFSDFAPGFLISGLTLGFGTGFVTSQITEFSRAGSAEVPLPAALPLFAGGLGVMTLLAWRRKQKARTVAN